MSHDRRLDAVGLGRRPGARMLGTRNSSALLTLPTTDLLANWDARAGVTEAATVVSAWSDSQASNDATTSAGTVTYVASVDEFGGLPGVQFVAGSVMTCPLADATYSGKYTVFAVVRVDDTTGGRQRLLHSTTWGAQVQSGTARTVGGWNGVVRAVGADGDLADGAQLITWSLGNPQECWIDGLSVGTTTSADNSIVNAVTIGSATNGLRSTIGQLLVYGGALDATERQAVWDYLIQEWGVGAAYVPGSAASKTYATVILAGQSNAVGYVPAADLDPAYSADYPAVLSFVDTPESLLVYRSRAWESLGIKTGTGTYGWGVELTMGRDLDADAAWSDVAIFKSAEGSTDLSSNWASPSGSKWVSTATVWDGRALALLPNAGDTFDVRAYVWIQGEADARDATKAANYEANLTAFIAAVRAKWGAGLPFVIVRLGASLPSPYDFEATVIAAQNAVAAADVNVHIVAAGATYKADGVHYDADALEALGQTIAATLIAEGA